MANKGNYLRALDFASKAGNIDVIIERIIATNVHAADSSQVRTDGWTGYDNLAKLGYCHDPIVIQGDQTKTEAHLPMIHIVFGNLTNLASGYASVVVLLPEARSLKLPERMKEKQIQVLTHGELEKVSPESLILFVYRTQSQLCMGRCFHEAINCSHLGSLRSSST